VGLDVRLKIASHLATVYGDRFEPPELLVSMDTEPHLTPVVYPATVGAGDAFSAVFILGLATGWPMQKIISHAQEFASAIVGQRGATVTDRRFYTIFLTKWSAE